MELMSYIRSFLTLKDIYEAKPTGTSHQRTAYGSLPLGEAVLQLRWRPGKRSSSAGVLENTGRQGQI
ncbi:hypothetical protein A33Q_3738 [Indibacter alkaliphilus LW1]|uniref:Uncharacterized protein n=1 Tax=Indibacter alkaliphilus (strain CCUG 57479 / KCTC 22604 / LW1) TaxID=1189612 RepID=S2D3L4_INDAL|nr:hypothetical protein A33Q_3738 [Indibacter alkaliphilus LW1]